MDRNSSNAKYQNRRGVKSVDPIVANMKELYDQAWYDKCIEAIDTKLPTLNSDETRIELLSRKALCFMRLFKFDKAEEIFLQVLPVATETSSYFRTKITSQLAQCYGNWAEYSDDAVKKQFYGDRCLEWIDCCLKNDRNHHFFLYNYIGDIMCDRENLEEALEAYNKANILNPKDFWAYRGFAKVSFKKKKFDQSVKYYDQAIAALEEENRTRGKNDSLKLMNLEFIEGMKTSRKKALESLPVAFKGEISEKVKTTNTVEEEEEKTTASYPKETVSIHSFEFPDLALDVPKFVRLEEAVIQFSVEKITKNHQFEIIKLNDEGDCHIIHAATGLALTVNGSDGIKLSLLEPKQNLDNQMWKIETQQDGASTIISNVTKKKLCAIYENRKEIKFLSKQGKLKEAGKLTLQDSKDTVKDGIDLWQLSSVNKL